MNNFKEIKELYFDKNGFPKITSEDVQMPFLRQTLQELYEYLKTSGDCTPIELKNIEDFLIREHIISNPMQTQNNNDKMKKLQEQVAQMTELTDQKLNSAPEGRYTYLLAHDPYNTSDSYYSHIHDRNSRSALLNSFMKELQDLSGVSNDELKLIQQMASTMTELSIKCEHDEESKKLIELIGSDILETETCPMDGKIDIVKGHLTSMIDMYAAQGRAPVHTGNYKRDRREAREQENAAYRKKQALKDEIYAGKYGIDAKNADRSFYLNIDDRFESYGRSSSYHYGGMFD